MINPNFVLMAISSCILAFAVGYAFWIKIRVAWLKLRIFEIHGDLRIAAKEAWALDDPAYLHERKVLFGVIDIADDLSLGTILYLMAAYEKYGEIFRRHEFPKTENAKLQHAIRQADIKLAKTLGKYITRFTLTGFGLGLMLKLWPKNLAKSGLRDAAAISVRSIDTFRRSALSGC